MKSESTSVVMARFICSIVFHIYLQEELLQGFSNMKYALNHPWKFEKANLAFFAGFIQVMTIIVLELVLYILLLMKNSHIDVVMSFVALVFIS